MASDIWQNWAGTQRASPRQWATPRNTRELAALVVEAATRGWHVKAVGAGHSFTGAAVTDGVLVSLDNFSGIESITPTDDGALVTVLAGTRLRALNEALWQRGYAMTNLGDIDAQSLAGALGTGTHGTGAAFGGLATQIHGLEIVTADGAIVTASADQNPELFEAARIGLGAIGIITKVTLACSPRFTLRAIEKPDTLSHILDTLDDECRTVDHFEFYWFPHTDRVLTKRNTRLPGDTPLKPVSAIRTFVEDEFMSNTLFEGVNRIATLAPAAIPTINQISSRLLGAREFTDRSYRVFASPRRVKFKEMEYAVPVEHVKGLLHEINQWLQRTGTNVAFPVEVRFAAADDLWLSTANGRDTAYVAVHQYHRRSETEYFAAVEAMAKAVDGRPHWGKMHNRTVDDLRPTYAKLDNFIAVRDKYDADRVFDNDYLRQVLGA
ncbi:MAG: FAD-binding protein [Rhodococcus sp. (in: high G+C Gram-positive bacteria)]|uniref:D-arabinono-1,4-lactone oxidase n=1 Tax=Rhodococcus sp. TaxID=1831 RepID=UPI00120BCE86|nr:D-arabinono-1,4-lactone oxidase [Rhodococcus sp. (in: high G+C Gram-positive bacteria)]RZL21073.1 MAG: FAD-binding protein [Rhodococcus sp. (in: high G+C Gram-positive bacteria)]